MFTSGAFEITGSSSMLSLCLELACVLYKSLFGGNGTSLSLMLLLFGDFYGVNFRSSKSVR